MSSTSSDFRGEQQQQQHGGAKMPVGVDYVPTEEEKMVFRECNNESFWYRSVPFSMISMALTKAMISKGVLTSSPRFGALPKVAFAGFCGYLCGKMSYMRTCQEKFLRLENSPLGEVLRSKMGVAQQYSKAPQSELSDPDTQSFEPMFQPAESPSKTSSNYRDNPYSLRIEPATQLGRADDHSAPGQYVDDEEPKRKSILYEDLRVKNRENYEVTLTQKADTLLKPTPEKEQERPKTKAKKNIYGDTWEE